jgi:hypothetical protein
MIFGQDSQTVVRLHSGHIVLLVINFVSNDQNTLPTLLGVRVQIVKDMTQGDFIRWVRVFEASPLVSPTRRQRLTCGSRITGDCYVRFCKSRGVRLPVGMHHLSGTLEGFARLPEAERRPEPLAVNRYLGFCLPVSGLRVRGRRGGLKRRGVTLLGGKT